MSNMECYAIMYLGTCIVIVVVAALFFEYLHKKMVQTPVRPPFIPRLRREDKDFLDQITSDL